MNKLFLLFFCIIIAVGQTYSQSDISERKKIHYLKKTERKNNRYVKQQEKRTNKLLTKLSKQENTLFEKSDSLKQYPDLLENSFEKIHSKLNESGSSSSDITSSHLSTDLAASNLDAGIKDYLSKQLAVSDFITDSTCVKCKKLNEQKNKTKQSIASSTEKLNRLKSIEGEIKKRKEVLKNYGANVPELQGKLKGLDKSLYYYNQGANGLKDLFTNPAKGIESNLLKKLSFNKSFLAFENQIKQLSLPGMPTIGAMPDLSGYQTKAQVQAMLPENNPGVDADIKAQLISNLQNSLKKFLEIRDERPNVSMFKDKPVFKVNPYRGLPLRKRIVTAFVFEPRLQTNQKPIITTLGLNIGFKLTGRLTPMIGASTRIGLGETIQKPSLTYQGIVARSGMDSKLAYGFSLQVWYEAMWKPKMLRLGDENNNYVVPSFIAGICNTYNISKRLRGTFMAGYNFLNNKYNPNQSPWIIRMGIQ